MTVAKVKAAFAAAWAWTAPGRAWLAENVPLVPWYYWAILAAFVLGNLNCHRWAVKHGRTAAAVAPSVEPLPPVDPDQPPGPSFGADELLAQALAKPCRLVCFVGFDVRQVEGCLCYGSPAGEPDEPARCVVVAVPDGSGGYSRIVLTDCATDTHIRDAGKVWAQQCDGRRCVPVRVDPWLVPKHP